MNTEKMLGVFLIGVMATLAGLYLALNNQSTPSIMAEPPVNNSILNQTEVNINPEIDVEKLVSSDGLVFFDADLPGELIIDHVPEKTTVYYKIIVRNLGDVPFLDINLDDTNLDLSGCAIPDSLDPGQSLECVIGPINSEEGIISNAVTVSGTYSENNYEDTDEAYYEGIVSKIKIMKETEPKSNTEFSFIDPDLNSFNLKNNGTSSESTFIEYMLVPGVYSFKEGLVEGWIIDDIVISGDDDYGSIINIITGTAVIDLDRGESITVTFNNKLEPILGIDVEKYVSKDILGPWYDADTKPDALRFNGITEVYWKVNVTNTGNVTVDLSWKDMLDDSELNLTSHVGLSLPNILKPGESAQFIMTSTTDFGMHRNNVEVNATYNDQITMDEDSSYYYIRVRFTPSDEKPPDFVIPEIPLGTIAATITMLIVLLLFRKPQIYLPK